MEKNLILQKAQSAEMSHDFATAERMYKQLLDDDPSNVNYLKAMGGIHVQAGEDEKAIPYYEQIIAYYPHYIEAMNSLGAIYRRLKRYEESINILQRALEEDRQIPTVNYNLGFTYKEMGNYDDAIEAFNYVITANPNDVLANNHLGTIYCALKEYPKSIAAFKHGLQIDPNHPILNYNLARCYEASKNYPDAIRCYGLALKTKPGWTEAIQDFSKLLIKCQKNKEAQETVEQAIKLHPDDINMLLLMGEVYLSEFDYDNAIRTYKKAKSLNETNVKTIISLADAYDRAEMIPQATEELLTALDLDTENVATKKLYISNLLSRGELDEAAFYLADLMNQEGAAKDLQLLDLYGQYYICKGEDEKAKENFNKIKFINHHYKDHMLHAARRYAQQEKYEQAEEFANKYVEQRPQNPDGFMSLGAIYEKKGDYIGAKNFFGKSLSMRDVNVLAKNKVAGLTDKLNDLDMYVPLQEIDPNEVKEEVAIEPVTDDAALNEVSDAINGDGFDFDQMGDSVGAEEEEDKKDEDYFENLASNVEDKFAKEEEDNSFEIQDPDKMEFADEETAFSFDQPEEDKNPLKDDEGGNFFDDMTPQDMSKIQEEVQGSADEARDSAGYAKDSAEFARGSADYAKDSAEIARDSAQAAREAAENARDLMNQLKEQQSMMQEQLMEQQAMMNEQMKQNAQNMVKEAVCDFLETTPEETPPSPSVESVETQPEETTPVETKPEEPQPEPPAPTEEEETSFDDFDSMFEDSLNEETPSSVEPVETTSEDPFPDEEVVVDAPVEEQITAEEIAENAQNDLDDILNPENITVEDMLDKIQKILQDDEMAVKNADKLELFKTLRILSNFLPESERNTFQSCRMRMMIEYIIAKLSGKPGLYKTTVSLIKSGILGEEFAGQLTRECDQELSNELIRKVISDMKKMAEGLEDETLAQSLKITADGILEKIELKNQQSAIF